jgi:hypothetical protein
VAAENPEAGGVMTKMEQIDLLLKEGRWFPYWGWHNDHEGKSTYRPAVMQDREEFRLLLQFLSDHNALAGSCLQLGMGNCNASHEVWRMLFRKVVTIDFSVAAVDGERHAGMDTHSHAAWLFAQDNGPLYDFLFIDAGHSLEDVSLDYGHYQLLVKPGGVIAFHDALERDGYPEVKVHEFLKGHPDWPITVFGNEIGTAVMVKT